MTWNVTVAAIVERAGRFLVVEEMDPGHPGARLEPARRTRRPGRGDPRRRRPRVTRRDGAPVHPHEPRRRLPAPRPKRPRLLPLLLRRHGAGRRRGARRGPGGDPRLPLAHARRDRRGTAPFERRPEVHRRLPGGGAPPARGGDALPRRQVTLPGRETPPPPTPSSASGT